MRTSLIGSIAMMTVLCVLALGTTVAAARMATEQEEHESYSGCTCQFGYGAGSCTDAVACSAEGGRCVRACVIPPE